MGKETCMFCFNEECVTPLKLLDNLEKEIAQIICPRVNLLADSKIESCHWMCCETCINKMKTCFSFKSCCLDIDDYLRNFLNLENEINLANVFSVISGKKQIKTGISDTNKMNIKLCRLCLDVINNDQYRTHRDKYVTEMITMCLPEIDLGLMTCSIFCEICISHLQKQYFLIYTFVDLQLRKQRINTFFAKKVGRVQILTSKKKSSTSPPVPKVSKPTTKDVHFLINGKEIKRCHNGNVTNNSRLQENKTGNVQRMKELKVGETFRDNKKDDTMVQQNNQNTIDQQSTQSILKSKPKVKEDVLPVGNMLKLPVETDIVIDLTEDDDVYESAQNIPNYTASEENEIKDCSETSELVIDLCDDIEENVSKSNDKCTDKVTEDTIISPKYTDDDRKLPEKNKRRNSKKRKSERQNDVPPCKKSLNGSIFKCSECDYKSKQSFDVELHTLLTHLDVNTFMTKIIINNETVYVCNECNFENVRDYNMWSHLLSHKKEVKSPPVYPCDVCSITFKSKSLQLIHKKSHQNIQCPYCQHKTDTEERLSIHLLNHKEDDIGRPHVQRRPEEGKKQEDEVLMLYQCKVCSFKATREGGMKRHITHHMKSNLKIIRCNMCLYSTNSKSKFAQHKHEEGNKTSFYVRDLEDSKSVKKVNVYMNVSEKSTFECIFCGFGDTDDETFIVHCQNCTKIKFPVNFIPLCFCQLTLNIFLTILRQMSYRVLKFS